MVSLDQESSRQGGYFFANEGGPSQAGNTDEEELIGTGLSSEDSPKFFPISSTWLSILLILILLACEALVLLIPLVIIKQLKLKTPKEQHDKSLTILIYIQSSVWLVVLVSERYLHITHRRSMRYGYLYFYRRTQFLRRVPFHTMSAGNVGIMILSGMYISMSSRSADALKVEESWPVIAVQVVVTVEVLVSIASLVIYTERVVRFNQKQSLPDVEQEEFIASVTQPTATLPDIGYRDTSYMENLLEKQADMIHYLHLRTAHLGKKLLRLTQLTHQSTGGNILDSIHTT